MKFDRGLRNLLSVAVILYCVNTKQYYALADEDCKGKDRLFDQHFGLALTPDDFLTPFASLRSFGDYLRPWRHLAALSRDAGSTIKLDKNQLQINLDVQHFSPDEITVKTAEGYVVIEGKHQEKRDEHGLVSRQFVRRYSLPAGATPESVVSELSSDGVLTVTVPKVEVEVPGERVVPITHTGPVRKDSKERHSCDDNEKDAEFCRAPTS